MMICFTSTTITIHHQVWIARPFCCATRPFFPIRHQESRLLRAIFRLHPSLKDVKVYEGLVDDPEVTIEGRGKHVKH